MAEVKDYSLGNFDVVVVKKDELLAKLRQNRDIHNAIYAAAVSGYWLEADKILQAKKVEFEKAVDKLNVKFTEQFSYVQQVIYDKDEKAKPDFSLSLSYNNYWPLKFPSNHLDEYQRIIDMLKFSVADKIELSLTDFDCYVRNNWAWKKDFVATNFAYASGAMFNDVSQFGKLARVDNIVTNFVSDPKSF